VLQTGGFLLTVICGSFVTREILGDHLPGRLFPLWWLSRLAG
jgi:hypothetical protein